MQESEGPDPLMTACDAVLREVGAYSIGEARLAEALPLIRSMVLRSGRWTRSMFGASSR